MDQSNPKENDEGRPHSSCICIGTSAMGSEPNIIVPKGKKGGQDNHSHALHMIINVLFLTRNGKKIPLSKWPQPRLWRLLWPITNHDNRF